MKRTIALPYGKGTVPLTLDESRPVRVLESRLAGYRPQAGGEELVRRAMERPIGAPRLSELARGCRRITVIISDHTRPVPSRVILPPMLEALREGAPDAEITLLVATGCHRGTREDELRAKLGDEIFGREHVVVHDCDDRDNLVCLGSLPSGQPLYIHRAAAEADLLAAEGFIEPHFFAGFSGGRKSVLPGVAARESVLGNHCSEFIADPRARTGVLEGNPIHRDMLWAARAAGLRFIVNVVLDAEKRAVAAFAGDVEQAHLAGCRFLSGLCRVSAPPADIVVTTNGGYPLDQNIYQAVKGMTAAEALVRPGGVIVMLARCDDGHGGEHFMRQIAEREPEEQMRAFLARSRAETEPDQWQTQIFLRVLLRARVILVSDAPEDMVRAMRMIPARDADEALALAESLVGGGRPSLTVVPDGVSVIAAGE